MSLKGAPQLRARLKAFRTAFKPLGKKWGEETARLGRARVPVKTGRLRDSIRIKNVTQRRVTVAAHYSAFFVDAGTKAHDIRPKNKRAIRFEAGNRPVFTKRVRHPRVGARPFRARIAREALEKQSTLRAVLDAWNDAA